MKESKDNILKRLKAKGAGFRQPDGYLDSFEAHMISASKVEDKEESGTPLTDSYLDSEININSVTQKTHGFKTPSGYFEEADDRFIPGDSSKTVVIRKINRLTYIGLSIAASLLLFFALEYNSSNHEQFELADINSDDIETWLNDDLISFNTYEIAEAYGDIELENSLYSDDELVDYLNDLDVENLILEN